MLVYGCQRIAKAGLIKRSVDHQECCHGNHTQGQQAIRGVGALMLASQCKSAEKKNCRNTGTDRGLGQSDVRGIKKEEVGRH